MKKLKMVDEIWSCDQMQSSCEACTRAFLQVGDVKRVSHLFLVVKVALYTYHFTPHFHITCAMSAINMMIHNHYACESFTYINECRQMTPNVIKFSSSYLGWLLNMWVCWLKTWQISWQSKGVNSTVYPFSSLVWAVTKFYVGCQPT